jgi:hypothetical protein
MPLPPSKATILVVDDEVPLRRVLARQLRTEGYTVLEAGYGTQALEVARNSSDPIDLVLSDIVMPGMIGTELAQHLLAEHPGIQVVLMSAHVVDAVGRPDRRHNVAVLQKPLEGSEVLALVQLLLNTCPTAELKSEGLVG